MDDVEIGDVIVLLPQHEEERVRELDELGEVVPPAAARHAHRYRIVRVIDRLTSEGVMSTPAGSQTLQRTHIHTHTDVDVEKKTDRRIVESRMETERGGGAG